MTDVMDALLDILCCAGSDHRVGQGGEHVNLVQTEWLATWPYLTATNVLVPESEEHPLASAVVCDQCIDKPLLFVVAGRKGLAQDGLEGEVYYERVPVAKLTKPAVYWPDLHPDRRSN